ncbi:MAG: anti-sigma factor [Chloroflexota bacterium]|nr:anti-sigma factor [Chloroflexota bacterium]
MNTQPNNQISDDWESQLIDYTLGVMEPAAALELGRKLEECRSHVLAAGELSSVAGYIGLSAKSVEPPVGHKQRLMARVASEPQLSEELQRSNSGLSTYAVTGSSIAPVPGDGDSVAVQSERAPLPLAPPVSLEQYRPKRKMQPYIPVLATLAAAFILFLGVWGLSLQKQLSDAQANLSVPNVPSGFVTFPVAAQPSQKGASAVAFLNRSTGQAYLYANGLQQVPQGKVYELWLFPPGTNPTPVAAGVFTPGSDGRARQAAATQPGVLRDVAGIAVTLEDAPGGTAPKGPMILSGTYITP